VTSAAGHQHDDESDKADIEAVLRADDGTAGSYLRLLPHPADVVESLRAVDVHEWPRLLRLVSDEQERADAIALLEDGERTALLVLLEPSEIGDLVKNLETDDAADVIEELQPEEQREALAGMQPEERAQVEGLLRFAPDTAGGLMQVERAQVRTNETVDAAIARVRALVDEDIAVHGVYVVDERDRLVGIMDLAKLLVNRADKKIADIMAPPVVKLTPDIDQEKVAALFKKYSQVSLPVVDADGRMLGRVLHDDVMHVAAGAATEDIQKVGGTEALSGPYLGVRMREMIKKRAGWLTILFVGEMLTASAMSYFEREIERAVVLALFVPLIISSGGNSGSQASTLIIRALALGEVAVKDWPHVLRRELVSGITLGLILGAVGAVRVIVWALAFHMYGPHFVLIAATVGISLVGVVLWGTVSGSMLPFALRRVGFDPASASAPFVATLIDVTGLVIYFSAASLIFLRAL
jgi:magnesium transporter